MTRGRCKIRMRTTGRFVLWISAQKGRMHKLEKLNNLLIVTGLLDFRGRIANPLVRFSRKKNSSTLLNFSDYEQKPNRKMKWLLLVFCKIEVWFLPIFCTGSHIFCMAISLWSALETDCTLLGGVRRKVVVVQKRQQNWAYQICLIQDAS